MAKHSLEFSARVKVTLENLEAGKIRDGEEVGMEAKEAVKHIADFLQKLDHLTDAVQNEAVIIVNDQFSISADVSDIEIIPTGEKSREQEITEMAAALGKD